MWKADHAFATSVALAAMAMGACADDAPPAIDAGAGAGLAIQWATTTAIPGPANAQLTLDEMHLRFSSVRAIGDAAPGDDRTTRAAFELEWGNRSPAPLEFEQAPAGLYTEIELGVGGDREAIELQGTVLINGAWERFEVEDEASLAIVVPTSLALPAGTREAVTITVDPGAPLAAIDFAALPATLGVRRLTRSDPQVAAFRAAFSAAFTADPPSDAPQ